MAYFVLMYREVWPDSLDEVLGRIRQRLASSSADYPGRQTSRVFQRLGEPSHLLTVTEWSDEQGFSQFVQSPVFAETNVIGGAPPTIVPLVPLIRFEHMARRAAIASCVTITTSVDSEPALQTFLVRTVHQAMKSVGGIVSREVYRARDTAGQFLVVHSWTSLAELELFRASDALTFDRTHEQLKTTMVAFTGSLAAQFSAFLPSSLSD